MVKRGQPDWGASRSQDTVSSLSDLAELAARLGSVDLYERSGNVIFLTGFEDGLAEFMAQTSGTGASVAIDTGRAYMGAQSVLLTGGSDTWKRAGILKRVKPVSLTKMGLEFTFSIGTNVDYLLLQLQYNDGSTRYRFGVGLDSADDEVQYRTGNFDFTNVQDYSFGAPDSDLWHTAKLIVDLDNLAFVRLYLNDDIIDLSSVPVWSSADATVKRFEVLLEVYSTTGNNGVANVDNLIVTINEP